MIVNKIHFFGPIHFGLLHLFHLALLGQEKNIVVTCVSGSLPKIIRIGRSTQLFYFIFWVCTKNLRSVGEPDTLFSWPYLQECRLPLHNARPTLKFFCFPLPDSIKREGRWNMLFLKEGKRILKHVTQKDTNLTNWISLKCFKTIWI